MIEKITKYIMQNYQSALENTSNNAFYYLSRVQEIHRDFSTLQESMRDLEENIKDNPALIYEKKDNLKKIISRCYTIINAKTSYANEVNECQQIIANSYALIDALDTTISQHIPEFDQEAKHLLLSNKSSVFYIYEVAQNTYTRDPQPYNKKQKDIAYVATLMARKSIKNISTAKNKSAGQLSIVSFFKSQNHAPLSPDRESSETRRKRARTKV